MKQQQPAKQSQGQWLVLFRSFGVVVVFVRFAWLFGRRLGALPPHCNLCCRKQMARVFLFPPNVQTSCLVVCACVRA